MVPPVGVPIVERAIAALDRGEMVVVVDDEDRQNEGDLVMAAELVTPERIAFFLRHTSGLICTALPSARADELELPLMVAQNTETQRTAFTVTVDAAEGTTTGISAVDRARTIAALADGSTVPSDLNRPGHMPVLRAEGGGVLSRPGHTEAAVDLARLAGLEPVGVVCQIVSADRVGIASRSELSAFAGEHGLVMISIAELAQHRRQTERQINRTAYAWLPTRWGRFRAVSYESVVDKGTHLALVLGDPRTAGDVVVRLHRECLCGDIFSSVQCSCHRLLDAAMARVAQEGTGVVVYLRGLESRGIGMAHALVPGPLRAVGPFDDPRRRESGEPDRTLQAGSPGYELGLQILADMGVKQIVLLSDDDLAPTAPTR